MADDVRLRSSRLAAVVLNLAFAAPPVSLLLAGDVGGALVLLVLAVVLAWVLLSVSVAAVHTSTEGVAIRVGLARQTLAWGEVHEFLVLYEPTLSLLPGRVRIRANRVGVRLEAGVLGLPSACFASWSRQLSEERLVELSHRLSSARPVQ